MPSTLAPLLWFAAVVALIPAALWLLRRTPLGGAAVGAAHLRSVGTLAISPTQRIVAVEVGTGGERRWLVLGVTPQSITTLHTLTPQDDAAAPAASAVPPVPPFAQLLVDRLRARPPRP